MSDTAWNRVEHFYCLICRQRCEAAEINAESEDPHGGVFVCDLDSPDDNHSVEEWERVEASADFIAAARELAPALADAYLAQQRVIEAAREFAHEDENVPWGYDAAGVHTFAPEFADSCRFCAALVSVGSPEPEPESLETISTTVLVRVGEHECVTCQRCACTFAVVHPACPRCSEEFRSAAVEVAARHLNATYGEFGTGDAFWEAFHWFEEAVDEMDRGSVGSPETRETEE